MSDDSTIEYTSTSKHVYIPSLHFPDGSQTSMTNFNTEDRSRLSMTSTEVQKTAEPQKGSKEEENNETQQNQKSTCCLLL